MLLQMLKYKLSFISSTYHPDLNIFKRFSFLLSLVLLPKTFLCSEIKGFLLTARQMKVWYVALWSEKAAYLRLLWAALSDVKSWFRKATEFHKKQKGFKYVTTSSTGNCMLSQGPKIQEAKVLLEFRSKPENQGTKSFHWDKVFKKLMAVSFSLACQGWEGTFAEERDIQLCMSANIFYYNMAIEHGNSWELQALKSTGPSCSLR